MPEYKLFSADSHVSEPLDLWTTRLDQRFRDRAPHMEEREQNGQLQEFWVFEGFEPHRLSVGVAAAAGEGKRLEFKARGTYAEARPGGWDPVERLKDQDMDGVDGEVLHTTLGFRLFWLEDPELQRACFRVYNDWLAEYCRHSPERLVGLALVSLTDVDLAVQELTRCARLGLKGAMIWNSPPDDRPYSSPEFDPFWSAAQELGMPLSLHSLTGHHESRTPLSSVFFIVATYHEVERTLTDVIMSGVLERFPRLQFVSVESQAGWIPHFLNRMDRAARSGRSNYPTRLTLTPSEYFHRQVSATYIDDPIAMHGLELIGAENLLWSSDYPHNASTWPHSQEVVDRDFAAFSPEVRRKVVRDNVMSLYHLDGAR
jgi:predicted TIM-barrel fold metal-dependent hydrolase